VSRRHCGLPFAALCLLNVRLWPARSTPWDKESTLSRNYKALGLARDPNEAHGRLNSVKRAAAEEEEAEDVSGLWCCAVRLKCAETRACCAQAEPTLGEQAQTDQEGLRVALGQHLPRGQRPPRQLTATQLVRPERGAITRELTLPPPARGRCISGGARGRRRSDGAGHQAQ
jgi:hypothetical protein